MFGVMDDEWYVLRAPPTGPPNSNLNEISMYESSQDHLVQKLNYAEVKNEAQKCEWSCLQSHMNQSPDFLAPGPVLSCLSHVFTAIP